MPRQCSAESFDFGTVEGRCVLQANAAVSIDCDVATGSRLLRTRPDLEHDGDRGGGRLRRHCSRAPSAAITVTRRRTKSAAKRCSIAPFRPST
jgi:hypothetical protein